MFAHSHAPTWPQQLVPAMASCPSGLIMTTLLPLRFRYTCTHLAAAAGAPHGLLPHVLVAHATVGVTRHRRRRGVLAQRRPQREPARAHRRSTSNSNSSSGNGKW